MSAAWLESGALAEGVIVVGLGGNLGGTEAVIARCQAALATLAEHWGQPRLSSYYRSAPVGRVQEQPEFINAVAAFRPEPPVSPEAALFALQRQEIAHDRSREIDGGPRTLDLDLLLHGQEWRTHEALQLPHPRMHQRAFVLMPLIELFGDSLRFGEGLLASECLAALDQSCQLLPASD